MVQIYTFKIDQLLIFKQKYLMDAKDKRNIHNYDRG
jgi:hypothetical protein